MENRRQKDITATLFSGEVSWSGSSVCFASCHVCAEDIRYSAYEGQVYTKMPKFSLSYHSTGELRTAHCKIALV